MNSEADPTAPATATISRVQLDAPNRYLNTLSIKPTSSSANAPPPTVILHGYGAGLGFFFHNFPPLANWAANRGASVYAVDWLGMGRSARVPFTIKAKKDDIPARVAEAESFFIDSLEEWRTKMGLKSMTIVGHSLGAYLSVAYALKYPKRVHKLILLSPAGVPHNPNTEEPERELRDNEAEIQHSRPPPPKERSSFQRATDRRSDKANHTSEKKPEESRSRRLLHHLWEEGWSPFQVLRSTVFWGPLLIGKVCSLVSYLSSSSGPNHQCHEQYTSRRFNGLSPEETRDLHDYITNITLAKGSGEYCISHILDFGAHARLPLVDRVHALRKDMRVTFMYGDHDWMDPRGGQESVNRMKAAGNPNGRLQIIQDAGHHCKYPLSLVLKISTDTGSFLQCTLIIKNKRTSSL